MGTRVARTKPTLLGGFLHDERTCSRGTRKQLSAARPTGGLRPGSSGMKISFFPAKPRLFTWAAPHRRGQLANPSGSHPQISRAGVERLEGHMGDAPIGFQGDPWHEGTANHRKRVSEPLAKGQTGLDITSYGTKFGVDQPPI